MKRVVLVLTLSLIVVHPSGAHSSNQKAHSDKARDGLIGPVHTVRTETLPLLMKAGELTEAPRTESSNSYELVEYDTDGNQTEDDEWRVEPGDAAAPAASGSKLCGKIVSIFDDSGRPMEWRSFSMCDGEPWVDHRWVFNWHANGSTGELFNYDRYGNLLSKRCSSYDVEGKEVENVCFRGDDANNRLVSRTYYYYDALAHSVTEATYNGDGSFYDKRVYVHDERENLTRVDAFDREGELFERDVYGAYEFDSAGNWIKRRVCTWWSYSDATEQDPLRVAWGTVTYRTITYF